MVAEGPDGPVTFAFRVRGGRRIRGRIESGAGLLLGAAPPVPVGMGADRSSCGSSSASATIRSEAGRRAAARSGGGTAGRPPTCSADAAPRSSRVTAESAAGFIASARDYWRESKRIHGAHASRFGSERSPKRRQRALVIA